LNLLLLDEGGATAFIALVFPYSAVHAAGKRPAIITQKHIGSLRRLMIIFTSRIGLPMFTCSTITVQRRKEYSNKETYRKQLAALIKGKNVEYTADNSPENKR
jgi:hypothetical protein